MVHAFLRRQVVARYPKLNNVADRNLLNTVSIPVSWWNWACCVEKNFL